MGKISFEELPVYIEMILEKISAIEEKISAFKVPDKRRTKLLTIQEASEIVHLKVSTIYGKISRKEIPHLKMDKGVRFEEDVLLEWVRGKSEEKQSASLYGIAEDFQKLQKIKRRK